MKGIHRLEGARRAALRPFGRSGLVLALCLGLAGGVPAAAQEAGNAPPEGLTLEELRTFADVFNIVRRNYVDEIPEGDLLNAALRGMVADLDGYSAYLGPEAFQSQDDGSRGRYGGIGVEVRVENRRLVVGRVIEDGPAWLAGIKENDRIISVDGVPVKGRPLHRSMGALKGEPGSTVTLRVRSGRMPTRTVSLERAYLPVPSVQAALLDGDVALLQLSHFHLETAAEFERELGRLRSRASEPLAGVIVDLRDNPGGVISSAAEIADGFLEEGLVVYTRGRYPASHLEYHARPGEWATGLPVVVLVNRGSASASEILAGALQDHGRATVVGSRTYGKGTVQSILELRNGAALKLTTARYFTPAGRSIDAGGIAPDVAADEAGDPTDASRPDIQSPAVSHVRDAEKLRKADGTLRRALRLIREQAPGNEA